MEHIINDAKKAFDLDLKILESNPKITLCENPSCMLCRARRWDNLIDMPMFVVRNIIPKIVRKVFKK